MKQKAITLAYSRIGNSYEVQQIDNSVLLKPGDWINSKYAEALCANPAWEVIMVPLHISMPVPAAEIISAIPAVL